MPPGISDKDYVIAQYDGAIAYMDACIQTIFTALEAHGIYDETIVVLNGDHGETLYDHECWFDHHGIYETPCTCRSSSAIPAKSPAGKRVSGFTQHKDLVPTLLELAGIARRTSRSTAKACCRWRAAKSLPTTASSTSRNVPGCASTAGAPRSGN